MTVPAGTRIGSYEIIGRWIAYQSDESGAFEIYVRPFPKVDDGRWQISTGGGTQPVWTRNGRELLYVASDGNLMSVPLQPGTSFDFGNATRVMDLSEYNLAAPRRNYEVSPDGQRFVLAKDDQQQGAARINVVLNWVEDLKKKIPLNQPRTSRTWYCGMVVLLYG